jgi:hypothetical protein
VCFDHLRVQLCSGIIRRNSNDIASVRKHETAASHKMCIRVETNLCVTCSEVASVCLHQGSQISIDHADRQGHMLYAPGLYLQVAPGD